MFIDNECRTFLTQEPVKSRVSYGTQLFSQRNKEEFLCSFGKVALAHRKFTL